MKKQVILHCDFHSTRFKVNKELKHIVLYIKKRKDVI